MKGKEKFGKGDYRGLGKPGFSEKAGRYGVLSKEYRIRNIPVSDYNGVLGAIFSDIGYLVPNNQGEVVGGGHGVRWLVTESLAVVHWCRDGSQ